MSLQQKLEEDAKNALKDGDKMVLSVLRLILSAIKNNEISQKAILSDDQVVSLLVKEAKKRQEAISAYQNAQRQDLAEQENKELLIIQKYLPQELSDEEIDKTVKETIATLKASTSDFGRVMGEVMSKLKGRASGDRVRDIVKKELNA